MEDDDEYKLLDVSKDNGCFIFRVKNSENKEISIRIPSSKIQELEYADSLKTIELLREQLISMENYSTLGRLISEITHELRNPLNYVINYSHIAKESLENLKIEIEKLNENEQLTELIEPIKQIITKIEYHSDRLNTIINDTLNQSSSKPEKNDINKLLDRALNLTYKKYTKSNEIFNLKIDKNYDSNLKPFEVFPGNLIRAFINLIDNSCYALRDKKSRLADFVPTLELTTHLDQDTVVIVLRDNGTGIPEEVFSKLFQSFLSTKPSGEGTGLGLSIVYNIIKNQHGGDIIVNTEPGQFTEFVIHLPINRLPIGEKQL